jgi:cytoskeletal protein CcmA (bactofilin family)
VAESRLELQATCHIEGEIQTRRMQLEEGAVLNGTVTMGEKGRGGTAPEAPGSVGAAGLAGDGERSRQPAVAAPRKV